MLRGERGIALLYLVILFTLLGVLISFGARKFGALVTQGKINEAKVGMERDVQMIVAWSVKNGRLPTSADYTGVFGTTPLDAWGKPVVYAYDNNMTTSAGGGLCGRTGTAFSYSGQDVAFLLISGGDDMNVTSTPNATGAFSGTLTLSSEDLYRIVTLKEVQEQAHCFGSTQGALRILNNELPKACIGKSYTATIYTDGGVPPVSFVFTGLLPEITISGAILSAVNITSAKGNYPVTVTATDSQAPTTNLLQRKYFMNVTSCS